MHAHVHEADQLQLVSFFKLSLFMSLYYMYVLFWSLLIDWCPVCGGYGRIRSWSRDWCIYITKREESWSINSFVSSLYSFIYLWFSLSFTYMFYNYMFTLIVISYMYFFMCAFVPFLPFSYCTCISFHILSALVAYMIAILHFIWSYYHWFALHFPFGFLPLFSLHLLIFLSSSAALPFLPSLFLFFFLSLILFFLSSHHRLNPIKSSIEDEEMSISQSEEGEEGAALSETNVSAQGV